MIEKFLVAFLCFSLDASQVIVARPQLPLPQFAMGSVNYQLWPSVMPIPYSFCPLCQMEAFKAQRDAIQGLARPDLGGSLPVTNQPYLNAKVTDQLNMNSQLTNSQSAQLAMSTLISALISYVNDLRQEIKKMASESKVCDSVVPSAPPNGQVDEAEGIPPYAIASKRLMSPSYQQLANTTSKA